VSGTPPALGPKARATRDTLYRTALDLFRRRGFDAVAVDDIVRAAGTSKGTFFRYFPTKVHVIAEWYGRTLSPDEEARPESFAAALDLVMGQRLELLQREPELLAAKFRNELQSPALAAVEAELDGKVRRLLAAGLRAELGPATTPGADDLADLALTILTGAARQWRLAPAGQDMHAILDARLATLGRLLHAAGLTIQPPVTRK
jgi:AcrR family transcriptional regulator